MSDALSIGVSGLQAFQQALDVTSNNISNSATPGYSAEQVAFTPAYSQPSGIGYLGHGVAVQSITRNYSETLAGQVRSSQSSYSNFNTLATQASNVDTMLSASTTGLTSSLQSFTNALQELATDPSQTASGQALLSQAQSLTQQLQNYNSQLSQYSSAIESQIGSTVPEINTIASGIANLNQQIATGITATGQQPNELLDQRDQLLNQLSQYVTVSTSTQPDGQMNVYIGNGQGLVVGGTAQTLAAIPNQYNPQQYDIGIATGGGSSVDITNEITGGTLGGLLTSETQVIQPTQNTLGQIATGVASVVNNLQQTGMTPAGILGTSMFSIGAPQASASAQNTGGASVTASVSDASALTADNYILSDSGGTWTLTDTTTHQAVAMTGSGTAADPLQADGLSLVVNGNANSGDSFLVQPTANAIAGMSVLLTNPNQIASAAALQGTATTGNTGTGVVSGVTVTDSTNAQLMDPVSISFGAGGQYTVTDTATGTTLGTGTYVAGQPIAGNGWSATITGSPAAGDSFTVGSNAGNVGDNTNLFAMIDALSSNTLDGGTTSLTGAANALVSGIGVQTQQAQANASTQQSVNQSATDALSNLSGVNLDQEAANMVQYQQAYQACAQVIQTSNTLFSTLISAIGH